MANYLRKGDSVRDNAKRFALSMDNDLVGEKVYKSLFTTTVLNRVRSFVSDHKPLRRTITHDGLSLRGFAILERGAMQHFSQYGDDVNTDSDVLTVTSECVEEDDDPSVTVGIRVRTGSPTNGVVFEQIPFNEVVIKNNHPLPPPFREFCMGWNAVDKTMTVRANSVRQPIVITHRDDVPQVLSEELMEVMSVELATVLVKEVCPVLCRHDDGQAHAFVMVWDNENDVADVDMRGRTVMMDDCVVFSRKMSFVELVRHVLKIDAQKSGGDDDACDTNDLTNFKMYHKNQDVAAEEEDVATDIYDVITTGNVMLPVVNPVLKPFGGESVRVSVCRTSSVTGDVVNMFDGSDDVKSRKVLFDTYFQLVNPYNRNRTVASCFQQGTDTPLTYEKKQQRSSS